MAELKPPSKSAHDAQILDDTEQVLQTADADIPEPEGYIAPRLIIGIGASAGGLQPLEDFFINVDPEAGHAYVVVQHLSPDFKSLMTELLGRKTTMTAQRAENGVRANANTVYLIPPRKNLLIRNGILYVEAQDLSSGAGPQFPIDVFFRSLATYARSNAVGIILSGTGSDGSRGIRAIDEVGGIIYVQDPATAQFDGMPNAARATGATMQMLPPAAIAASVSELTEEHPHRGIGSDAELPTSEIEKILTLMSSESDNDFSAYKLKTMSRRVERRRLITGVKSLEQYFKLLQDSDEERQLLRSDLLISVTNFFRDENAWKYLRDTALPKLIEATTPNTPLRIWVSACSTGEEAYTMAMVAREALEKAGREQQAIKIFATDINAKVLDRAAAGVYPESIVTEVPPHMLSKYFSTDGDSYVVTRRLREMIIFAPHNLLADAPFTRMQLVSCRNALIYLKPEAQKRIISMMHFSLVPNGVLFLGASESVGSLDAEFDAMNRKWCIFSKLRDVRMPIESSFSAREIEPRTLSLRSQAPSRAPHHSLTESMMRDALQAVAVERNWVCMLCDGRHHVLHIIGNSQRYLRVPQGDLTNEAIRLVPDELSTPLRSSLYRARREQQTVNHFGVQCEELDTLIDLQVIYRPSSKTTAELFIVVITHSASIVASKFELAPHEQGGGAVASQIRDLEYELRHTRDNLQATIEQLETTNEEQQATNEQLTAANEELQSTNEELHSVNEELYTVNSEYQLKITELTEVTNDINNLLESTDIGVVFLDNSLKIRKFTPAATRDVRLQQSDIGRSFDDLSYDFDYPELKGDLRRVLSLGEAIEREVKTNSSSEFLLVRIHPYRAGSELTVGIVMTFINISELKRVEDALAQVETRYRHLFQSEMFGIILGDMKDRAIVDANDAFLGLLNYSRTDLPLSFSVIYPDSEHAELERTMRNLETSGTNPPLPTLLKTKSGDLVSVVIGQTLTSEPNGAFVGLVLATDRLSAQTGARLQQKAHELETARENLQQFAYVSSHQLQEPLRAVNGFAELLSRSYAEQLDDKGRQYLQFILDGADRLSSTISDLLLFSRVQTHAEPLSWVKAEIAVHSALNQLDTEIQQSKAQIYVGEMPVIFADLVQIQQAFKSLVHNALKFSGDQIPNITITAAKDDDNWRFSITDKGVGIARDRQKQIFLIFHKENRSVSSHGVGLAICQRIIERHHGRIWVDSVEGEGTTVHFTIPTRSASEQ